MLADGREILGGRAAGNRRVAAALRAGDE